MLQGVLLDETLEVLFQLAGDFGGAPRARTIHQALGTMLGKAPQDGFVCIEQNDLAPARLVLEGGKFECAVSEISRGGI